jgi:hypothetical protein
MFTREAIRVSILVGLAFIAPQAFAQKRSPNSDPQTKPRKVKEEPAKAFKQFIVDVEPILTDDERRTFAKLQTNDEREQWASMRLKFGLVTELVGSLWCRPRSSRLCGKSASLRLLLSFASVREIFFAS